MKTKEQKKNEASVLVAESAYSSENAQFGLIMNEKKRKLENYSEHVFSDLKLC